MKELVMFVLCAYGLTQILVYSKILESVRPSHYLFHCSMCMGFWVGIVLWLGNGLTSLFTFDYSLATGLFLGFLSSGTSYILSQLFDDCGLKISVFTEKTKKGGDP